MLDTLGLRTPKNFGKTLILNIAWEFYGDLD